VSDYLPCEALRVLSTEATADEEEQAISNQLSAVSSKKF
jgi:hypothetical protein